MHRIRVSEIMSEPVITIDPDALAVDAAQLMEANNVRRIIVIDQDGFMCGIVTDADVLEAETAESVASRYDPGLDEEWLTVRDVMTADVIAAGPEESLGQLVEKMMETKIGGIPVVQSAGPGSGSLLPVGIVTETDIFRLISDAWRADEASNTTDS